MEEAPESPQHCLLECPLAKRVWEAFYYVWHKWGAPNDVTLSWPFVMLGEAIFERKDDPPEVQGYHVRGFSYIKQPLDILHSFIFTSFGRRDAGSISITSIPLGKSFSKPGWLLLRLGWPLERHLKGH
jgi:hypothetical protein